LEPSGFPLGWIISLALLIGIRRERSRVEQA
jgi:hypothetical protein